MVPILGLHETEYRFVSYQILNKCMHKNFSSVSGHDLCQMLKGTCKPKQTNK